MLTAGSARQEGEAEGGSASSKLRSGGLPGLATVSMAIYLAACEPPPAIDDKSAYLFALMGIFLAGVAHVLAAVWASDDDNPRVGAGCRRGARSKLKYASVVAPFVVVAAGLSAWLHSCGN